MESLRELNNCINFAITSRLTMKNVALIITLLFYILFSLPVWGNRSEEVETALRELQYTIGLSDDYDRGKTKEIDALKSKLNHSRSYDTGYFLTSRLIEEYEAYLCDSALYYVNKNIVNARTRGDKPGEIRVLLTKCDILGRAGLFMEALDLLNTIDPESLDGDLKQNYYSTAYSIAQFMYENATGTEYAVDYLRKTQLYCDSAVAYTTPGTFDYARLRAAQHLGRHEYGACISLLDSASQCYESGEREYSILRSTQGYAASKVDSLQDEALLWIAEAAISDIKGSIKENTASRALAERLYEQGRVKYANAFAKKSMEDASFFSARMRSAQSAQMLPIIDRQYERLQNESQERTRVAIVVLVGVAIGLAICLFLIVRLTHRLRSANDQLVESSEEVKELNRQQRYAAEETHQLNIKLREATI